MDKQKLTRIPEHIAVIMDGNGRWAQKQGLPRSKGHEAGAENVRKILKEVCNLGIGYLTLYAFSTENWKRPEAEVKGLMKLLVSFVTKTVPEFMENNIRFNVIGDMKRFSLPVRTALKGLIYKTRKNSGTVLNLALNYGGRNEIAEAVRGIAADAAAGRIKPDEVSEELITSRLYTAGMPDPDLVIRTAGEMRLSNFLLWQVSYAEFWATDCAWPDFDINELHRALENFANRKRRYGGLTNA